MANSELSVIFLPIIIVALFFGFITTCRNVFNDRVKTFMPTKETDSSKTFIISFFVITILCYLFSAGWKWRVFFLFLTLVTVFIINCIFLYIQEDIELAEEDKKLELNEDEKIEEVNFDNNLVSFILVLISLSFLSYKLIYCFYFKTDKEGEDCF